MTLTERKNAFIALGSFISQFVSASSNTENISSEFASEFEALSHRLVVAEQYNPWFTQDNLQFALQNMAEMLSEENLDLWLSNYTIAPVSQKTVAVIMAGNLPLVGFHDFLCVLLSGHNVLVKQSSKDKQLLPFIAAFLEKTEAGFKGKIGFTEGKLTNFDAIIATGSNNTARYFDFYFKKYPHIIRKNRSSVAILTGQETEEELAGLAEDIFRYFGLGCRSVSKLFVPKEYDFAGFFKAVFPWHTLADKQKYANNYDYNKAVYLMSLYPIQDNGFLILKEDTQYASPIATVFYEYYDSISDLKSKLDEEKEQIQCIVAKGFTDHEVAFGTTQQPKIHEYADQVDTMAFLLKI